jgi:hypothetical protein
MHDAANRADDLSRIAPRDEDRHTFDSLSDCVSGHDRVFVRAWRVLCPVRFERGAQTVENPVRVVKSRAFDPE